MSGESNTRIMRDTQQNLSTPTITLHWLVAIGMIAMLSIGTYMAQFKVYPLYPIHKSIGILLLLAILVRIGWRVVKGWPAPAWEAAGAPARWQRIAARASHVLLLVGTALMPISGMVMSALGGRGLHVFGLELLAANIDPASGKAVAHNDALAGFAHGMHHWVAWILIAAVALHICGALKHHLIDRDNTLRRMLGR